MKKKVDSMTLAATIGYASVILLILDRGVSNFLEAIALFFSIITFLLCLGVLIRERKE